MIRLKCKDIQQPSARLFTRRFFRSSVSTFNFFRRKIGKLQFHVILLVIKIVLYFFPCHKLQISIFRYVILEIRIYHFQMLIHSIWQKCKQTHVTGNDEWLISSKLWTWTSKKKLLHSISNIVIINKYID